MNHKALVETFHSHSSKQGMMQEPNKVSCKASQTSGMTSFWAWAFHELDRDEECTRVVAAVHSCCSERQGCNN